MSLAKKTKGINILDPENMELYIDEEEELRLRLKDEDKEYKRVQVNPAFPLSKVGSYLSFAEEEGSEIGMLRDMNELSEASKEIVEEILEKIYFMPKIVKINSIEEQFGLTQWDVETEKGHRVFDIKSRRSDVRPFGNRRIIIHDVDGNRYEIPDHAQLDEESQKTLRSEI